jgi:uncharacterized protein
MNLEKIHLIESKDMCLSYYYPTADIRILNRTTYNILSALKAGKEIHELLESCKEKEQTVSLIKSIFDSDNNCKGNNIDSRHKRKVIRRITLHVSNDCNLRCKYCFGNGGSYNQERKLMTEQTAREFVDFCVNQFERIEKIVFFGGEPMLNLKVMELVCARFKYYKEERKIKTLPKFIIITNGTILTDRMLAFIKENISIITVSIDGPKEINDIQRIYKDGKGSYEKIARFISTIQQETNVKMQYEATYTQLHIDYNYSHEDISRFLDETFGISGVIINEQGLSPQLLLDFWNTVDLEYLRRTKLKYLPKDFWVLLYTIIRNTVNPICSVIEESFAVSSSGTIYACHIINGTTGCELGAINGKNVYNHSEEYKPFDHEIDFRSNDMCKNCWMIKLCGGCSMSYFFNRKTNQFEMYPNEELCKITRLYAERILLLIASIRKDTQLWSLVVQKLND